MELRLLGPIEVLIEGVPLPLTKRQHRLILGILGLEANRPVHRDRLIELVWGPDPPRRARAALHSRVSELRTALRSAGLYPPSRTLATYGTGYTLRIVPEQVDVHRFRSLLAESRKADSDDLLRGKLRQALSLWRGPVLDGWAPDRTHDALRRGLESARLTAAEDLYEAELRAANHQAIVDELVELAAANPGRDRLTAALMLALHRSGRTAEAIEVYHRHQRWLGSELGVDPGRPLQEVHRAVLRDAATPEDPT